MWSEVVISRSVFVWPLFLVLVGCEILFYEEANVTHVKSVACNHNKSVHGGLKNTIEFNNIAATLSNSSDNSSNNSNISVNTHTDHSINTTYRYLKYIHADSSNNSSEKFNTSVSDCTTHNNSINILSDCQVYINSNVSNLLSISQTNLSQNITHKKNAVSGSQNMKRKTSNATFYYDANSYNSNFLVEDNGMWFVCKRHIPGVMDRIVENGDGRGGKNMIYARGEAGNWYKFYKPPITFVEYLIQLPACFDSFIRNGSDWFVLSRKGTYLKVVKRGSRRKQDTLYVMAEDDIWYRARKSNMTNQFAFDIAQLPIANDIKKYETRSQKSYENELIKEGDMWYVKIGGKNDKLVERGCTRKWKFLCYYKGESGKWYRFMNPPEECMNYMDKLPIRPEAGNNFLGDMFNFK